MADGELPRDYQVQEALKESLEILDPPSALVLLLERREYPSSRPHTVHLASRSAHQAVLGRAALSPVRLVATNPQNEITVSTRSIEEEDEFLFIASGNWDDISAEQIEQFIQLTKTNSHNDDKTTLFHTTVNACDKHGRVTRHLEHESSSSALLIELVGKPSHKRT